MIRSKVPLAKTSSPQQPKPKPQKKYPSALTVPCQQLLTKGLKQLGFEHSDKLFSDIQAFLAEIELWNPHLGLVEAGSEELIVKHVLDSLVAYPVFAHYSQNVTDESPYIDMGSGAGFPALLLLLAQRAFTVSCVKTVLLDKQKRRCQFLANAIARLGLSSRVSVSQELIENLQTNSYGLLTARAFKPLDQTIFALLSNCLRPNAAMLLFKGRKEKLVNECLDAKLGMPLELEATEISSKELCTFKQLKVPFLHEERHLLIISRPETEAY